MEVPEDFAAAMLQDAPPFWHEQTPDAQAADIELCHPAPGPNEARVTVTGAAGTRRLGLSVVTADRSGVLAASAAVISRHGMTIGMALASSWAGLGIALQRFQVSPAPGSSRVVDPAPLVADLSRTLTTAGEREASTVPGGLTRLRLGCEPLGDERYLLSLFAPDRPGLLSAVCSELERDRCDIEMASIASVSGTAEDLLVVRGEPDLDRLGAALVGPDGDLRILPPGPLTAGSAQRAMRRLVTRSLAADSPRSRELAHRLAHRRRAAHTSR